MPVLDILEVCFTTVSHVEYYRNEKFHLVQLRHKLRSQLSNLCKHSTRLTLLRDCDANLEKRKLQYEQNSDSRISNMPSSNFSNDSKDMEEKCLEERRSFLSRMQLSKVFNICLSSDIIVSKDLNEKLGKFFWKLYTEPGFAAFIVYSTLQSPKNTITNVEHQKLVFNRLVKLFSNQLFNHGLLPEDEKRMLAFHVELTHRLISSLDSLRISAKAAEVFLNMALCEYVQNCEFSLRSFVSQFVEPLAIELLLSLLPFPREYEDFNLSSNSDSDCYSDMQQLFNPEVNVRIDEHKFMRFCHSLSLTFNSNLKYLPKCLITYFNSLYDTLKQAGFDSANRKQMILQLFLDRVICPQIVRLPSMIGVAFESSSVLKTVFQVAAHRFKVFCMSHLQSKGESCPMWLNFKWLSVDSQAINTDSNTTQEAAASGSAPVQSSQFLLTTDQFEFLISSFGVALQNYAHVNNVGTNEFEPGMSALSELMREIDQMIPSGGALKCLKSSDSGNLSAALDGINFQYMGSLYLLDEKFEQKVQDDASDPLVVMKFEFASDSYDCNSMPNQNSSSNSVTSGTDYVNPEQNNSKNDRSPGGADQVRNRSGGRIGQRGSSFKSDVTENPDRRDLERIENVEVSSVTSEKSTAKKLLRFDVPSSTQGSAVGVGSESMMDFASEAASVRSACSLDFDHDTDALSDLLLNEPTATRSDGGRSTPRSMITSDDGLLDSAASTVASTSVNSSFRPPGSSSQRLPNPAENINDKFGKFEIEKGPLDKRSARGDMKDMRQNSTISATSTAGGVTGAGDLQSDTWSVDAYASEEGSEPPPEPTSVERLSEIMEDCELNGSLRTGTRDVTTARSSALSLASVTDEISLPHVPIISMSEATTSSHLNHRSAPSMPGGGSQIETAPLDNRNLEAQTNDESLGAIGGVDVNLLEVLDDNNSDTWSVDVAASEFELNEEQRLDEFLDESARGNEDSGMKYHSRRGSRRGKKSSLGFVSSTCFEPSATLSYDDFVANQVASDSGFGALTYDETGDVELAMLHSETTANLQNDRLTLLMNAEHDVSPSLQAESSLDVNLSSQYSNAGSSVHDSGISGSMQTCITVSSLSSTMDANSCSTHHMYHSSLSRASGGARPKTTSGYHHHHHASTTMTGNETVGQQRVTVKSPPIECLPRKKARRIESSSTHSSPADESLLEARGNQWYNEDTASSNGAGQRSRNVSTGGVSTELMQQASSVSNQDIHAAISADDNVFLSPMKRKNEFKKMSEDLSFSRPALAWAEEADYSSLKGAGRLSQSEVSDRLDYLDSNSLLEDFGVGGLVGPLNSSSASLDVGPVHVGNGTGGGGATFATSGFSNLPGGGSSSAEQHKVIYLQLKRCLTSILVNYSSNASFAAAINNAHDRMTHIVQMSTFGPWEAAQQLLNNQQKLSQFLAVSMQNLNSTDVLHRARVSMDDFSDPKNSEERERDDRPASPTCAAILAQTALSLVESVGNDELCDKLAEDLQLDNKTIQAHNSQLMKSRNELNAKMQLITARTKQIMAECVKLQQNMFTRLCNSILNSLNSDIRALQEDILKNNLEMSKQRANLETVAASLMTHSCNEIEKNGASSHETCNRSTNIPLSVSLSTTIVEDATARGTVASSAGSAGLCPSSMIGLVDVKQSEVITTQLRLYLLRQLTERFFTGIIFPCGSASFAKDRILFSSLQDLTRQLDEESCESLLGLPKKYTIGFPWHAAVKVLIKISFQKIGEDLVQCIFTTVTTLCTIMQMNVKEAISSDHLVPALMAVIIKTNPPLLFSLVEWLKSHELELLRGKTAFAVTTFLAAFEQIVQLFVVNYSSDL